MCEINILKQIYDIEPNISIKYARISDKIHLKINKDKKKTRMNCDCENYD